MRRSGRRGWAWLGAAAAVVTLGSGCLNNPIQQHSQPYETFNAGGDRGRPDGQKSRFDTSAGYADEGYFPPGAPGSGQTLTRSYVPPVEGAAPLERLDATTAPRSSVEGIVGSAATGTYVEEELAYGGAGEALPLPYEAGLPLTGTERDGRNTVNPGRGSLPELDGTGNSLLPIESSVPMELRWGAGMWGRPGE